MPPRPAPGPDELPTHCRQRFPEISTESFWPPKHPATRRIRCPPFGLPSDALTGIMPAYATVSPLIPDNRTRAERRECARLRCPGPITLRETGVLPDRWPSPAA